MYPKICEMWCANFGTPNCPNSDKCMATADKPYFKGKTASTLTEKWRKKRRIRKICKANNYNCSECIYHEYIFEGTIFRGTKCRLEDA